MDNFTVITGEPSDATGSAIFAVKAHLAPDYDKARAGSLYLTAPGLGCSRDFRTTTDRAIKAWFAEHALTVVNITRR